MAALRLIALILSLGILGSAFLPWIDMPLIMEASLYDLVQQVGLEQIRSELSAETPVIIWLFVVSFAMAALTALVSLASFFQPLTFLTGAMPVGVGVWTIVDTRRNLEAALGEVPFSTSDITEVMGIGVWGYLACGALLLLLGLTGSAR
jgi:hypothetical protein